MATNTNLRAAYRDATGIPKETEKDSRQGRALARAYELRNFEIDLLWKRATYFFTVQAAVFTAYALIASKVVSASPPAPNIIPGALPLLLAMLGLAAAFMTFFSSFGSRFWQENWEHHIDLLEGAIEGDLHKTIVQKTGRLSFSVSRSQIGLTVAFVLFWTILVISSLNSIFDQLRWPTPAECAITLSAAFCVAVIGIAIASRLTSRITGLAQTLAPDSRKEADWTRQGAGSAAYKIIKRDSPVGK